MIIVMIEMNAPYGVCKDDFNNNSFKHALPNFTAKCCLIFTNIDLSTVGIDWSISSLLAPSSASFFSQDMEK